MLIDDVDELITIGSCVFMPESDNMTQFVDNNSELVTILSDADHLGTVLTSTHERTTPEKRCAKIAGVFRSKPREDLFYNLNTNMSLKQYQECCA